MTAEKKSQQIPHLFHEAHSSQQLNDFTRQKFSDNSQKKMKWVVDLYNQWHAHYITALDCPSAIKRSDLNFPNSITKTDLMYTLLRFVTEICKLNSDNYPPRTIYQIVICLQMYLESSKVYFKLLSKEDPTFVNLYFVIDNLMKECTEAGLGKVKSAEYISTESEEKM